MSLAVMKLALEALEEAVFYTSSESWSPSITRECEAAITALRQAIKQAEQAQPVAWVYPGALEAFKKGNPWVAYGSNGDGPHSDGVQRIPLYLNDAVARRVEPPAAESGAGFESLPASPHKPSDMSAFAKLLQSNPALALDFFKSAGILGEDGELAPEYQGEKA